MTTKLNYEEFFEMAILKLRDTSKSSGIHSVYSGFNKAFREYFGYDPVKVSQELASEGKIEIRPVRGGVMIYLPGDAPKSRGELGKAALSRIFDEPHDHDKGLVEKVLSEVAPQGIRKFPDDFLEVPLDHGEMIEVVVPGTPLQLDPHSQTIVNSPLRLFRYEAKNPPEAKYIIYAHQVGQQIIRVPRDNRAVFKAVISYAKYCQQIRDQSFTLFLRHTNDENMAQLLTKELLRRTGLRA